jgi:lipopolysaccharide exporter
MLKTFIPRSSFAKNVLTLITGATIAQAIPIVISPIISRLYSPDDFGQFAIFMAITAIIGSVATLRYEMAIVLPNNNKDAINLLTISVVFSFLIAGITLLTVFLLKCQIAHWSGFTSNPNYLYFIPLSVLSIGCYQAFNYWSTHLKQFKNNAVSKVAQTSTNSVISITVGTLQKSPFGLIIGQVIGQMIAALVLFTKTIRSKSNYFKDVSWATMKQNLIKYKHHAGINSSHVLLDSILNHGITFLLVLFFTNAIVGFYAFAYRILKAPLSIIGSAMSQVFFQEASVLKSNGKSIQPLVTSIYKKQLLLGLLPFTVLLIFTPQIFAFIFGSQWREAGIIAQILLPWIFLNFLVSPVSTITIVAHKQKEALLLTIVDGLFKFTSILIGHYVNSYLVAFTLMSVSGCLLMVFDLFWYYRIAKND